MAFDKEKIASVVVDFGQNPRDTGSTKVQIVLLTNRIENLKAHFNLHVKDHASRRGLLSLVGKRRRLLRYLQRTNLESYRTLIKKLGLRK